MARKLIRLKQKAEKGPLSEGSLRWLIFNEDTNDLRDADAVVRIGNRVFIDEDKFDTWIETQNAQARAA
jgi:hypothetical protein